MFRVDLRLRPDGMNGPLVNSLPNTLLYYESWGQTWERVALLKARPVAGDKALGEQFLRDVAPFVFRRYLDFATIEDIKEMKDGQVYLIIATNNNEKTLSWGENRDGTISGSVGKFFFKIAACFLSRASGIKRARIHCPFPPGF